MTGAKRPLPNGKVRIVPSLLAADFAGLNSSLSPLVKAGARWASVDVMDGHFVPNLSFGPEAVRDLKGRGRVFLDAHLMVENPERFGPLFARAGADWIMFHVEACRNPRPLLKKLRSLGVGVGLAIVPKTPVSALLRHLDFIDLALVMTVEPGFGGQSFMADMMPKVRALRRAIDAKGLKVWLQVDGGINKSSVERAAAAGADSLVAGSAVFKAGRPVSAMRELERLAQEAFDKRRN